MQPLVEKLMPNSILKKTWTHISADFITKLPLAQEYDSILVVVDRFIKMAYFVLTTERTSTEGLAQLFRDNIWKLHRLPDSIISDRGPQYYERIKLHARDQDKAVYSIPSTNQQCNKMAGKLEHLQRQIILFLFHFPLLCNNLKCVGHYDSKEVHGIIQVDKY